MKIRVKKIRAEMMQGHSGEHFIDFHWWPDREWAIEECKRHNVWMADGPTKLPVRFQDLSTYKQEAMIRKEMSRSRMFTIYEDELNFALDSKRKFIPWFDNLSRKIRIFDNQIRIEEENRTFYLDLPWREELAPRLKMLRPMFEGNMHSIYWDRYRYSGKICTYLYDNKRRAVVEWDEAKMQALQSKYAPYVDVVFSNRKVEDLFYTYASQDFIDQQIRLAEDYSDGNLVELHYGLDSIRWLHAPSFWWAIVVYEDAWGKAKKPYRDGTGVAYNGGYIYHQYYQKPKEYPNAGIWPHTWETENRWFYRGNYSVHT